MTIHLYFNLIIHLFFNKALANSCGKQKPLKPKYIPDQYQRWADQIQQFMKQAYGGESKENSLCRFVRIYIEKHNKCKSREEMLTSGKIKVNPFSEELKLLPSDNQRRNTIIAVNEFLNYVISTDLTVEDDYTGEIVRVMSEYGEVIDGNITVVFKATTVDAIKKAPA